MNLLIILNTVFRKLRQHRMTRSGDGHIGYEHHSITNINLSVIHHCVIKIGIYPVPHMNVMAAPVCVEGRLYKTSLSALGKHFLHPGIALLFRIHRQIIELLQPAQIRILFPENILIARIINQSCHHTFFLCHFTFSFSSVIFLA